MTVAVPAPDGRVGAEGGTSYGVQALLAVESRVGAVRGTGGEAVCITAAVRLPLLGATPERQLGVTMDLMRRLEADTQWLHAVEWLTTGEEVRGGLSLLEANRLRAGSAEEEARFLRYKRVLEGSVPERCLRFGSLTYLPDRLIRQSGAEATLIAWLERIAAERPALHRGVLRRCSRGWIMEMAPAVFALAHHEQHGRAGSYKVLDILEVDQKYDRLRSLSIVL